MESPSAAAGSNPATASFDGSNSSSYLEALSFAKNQNLINSAIHSVDILVPLAPPPADLPAIAEQKPSQETDPTHLSGVSQQSSSLPRRTANPVAQPKQKAIRKVQTIKNTEHYRPVAMDAAEHAAGEDEKEPGLGLGAAGLGLGLGLEEQMAELRAEQQRMARELECVKMENRELRSQQQARDYEDRRRVQMLKQKYEQMVFQLGAQCEAYAASVEELKSSHDALLERTRSHHVIEEFFIK